MLRSGRRCLYWISDSPTFMFHVNAGSKLGKCLLKRVHLWMAGWIVDLTSANVVIQNGNDWGSARIRRVGKRRRLTKKVEKVRLSQGLDFWSAGRPKCINHLYAMGGWAVHANSFALSRPWQGCGKRKPTTESQTQIFGQCQSPIALIESSEKYTKQIEKFQTHKCSYFLSLNCNVRWDDKEAWARRCIANGVCMIRD